MATFWKWLSSMRPTITNVVRYVVFRSNLVYTEICCLFVVDNPMQLSAFHCQIVTLGLAQLLG